MTEAQNSTPDAAEAQQPAPLVPPSAVGRQSHGYSYKGKAATARPAPTELPTITDNIVLWLQDLFGKAGFNIGTERHPDGKDHYYGPLTAAAVTTIAADAQVRVKDMDFVHVNQPAKDFLDNLQHRLPGQARTTPAAHVPTAAEIAAAEAARRAAEEAARRAAEEKGINPAIRGTQFDPRYLKTVSDAELNNILKDGLHGLGEIQGGVFGSYHRNGQLGDVTTAKVLEQEKKLLGMDGPARREGGMDRETLERVAAAMGERIAADAGLAPRDMAVASPNASASIAGSEYDPARLATATPTDLLATIKDGLLAKHEISRHERNDPFFAQTREFQKEVFKQERELGLTAPGHETMDPEVLRALAAKLGQDAAVATHLNVDPAIRTAIDQARTAGALPPEGTGIRQQAMAVGDTPSPTLLSGGAVAMGQDTRRR